MTADNALAVLTRASREEIIAGASWYTDAHALAYSLSPDDITVGAGVIAALSPQTNWRRNQIAARQVFNHEPVPAVLGASVVKARRILAGEPALSVLGGNKVRSFYANIIDPHGAEVTIDRHAVDALYGYRDYSVPQKYLSRKGAYEAFADMYRAAASVAGIAAPTLQAIVWVVWRNEKGLQWAG